MQREWLIAAIKARLEEMTPRHYAPYRRYGDFPQIGPQAVISPSRGQVLHMREWHDRQGPDWSRVRREVAPAVYQRNRHPLGPWAKARAPLSRAGQWLGAAGRHPTTRRYPSKGPHGRTYTPPDWWPEDRPPGWPQQFPPVTRGGFGR